MKTNNIRKTLLGALILLIAISNVWAQPKAPPMLDPRRFDAWTVEYEPFRLLIENAVEEYITLNDTELPPIASTDKVIAVRSKSGQRQLYQIRYGTVSDGFSVIDNLEIKWVLGGTLSSTISEKEKYYHLDTQEPFETTEHQPEIDYLEVESFWTHTDLQIGADRLVYLFGKSGGITVEWGNELFGRPYGEAGFARFGVITPLFKLGVQVPSPYIPLGYTDGVSGQHLIGGIGAFGAFKYKVLYGELFFQSLESAFVGDNIDNIDSYDLGVLMNLNFNTTLSGFKVGANRIMAGAMQIRLGGVVARVDHNQTVNGVLYFQDHMRDYDETDEDAENYTYGGSASTDDSGPFFRIDYASPLIEKRFPRHEAVFQLSGPSLLTKYTYNLNQGLAIPLTFITYTTENDWTPGIAVLVGFKLRLDQN